MLEPIFSAIIQFWYFIPLFIVVSIFKSSIFRGWLGEFRVNRILKRKFSTSEYKLLANITLPTNDGSTQIDHILTSPYGIFVIETKNYRGWIFGSEKQATWTQTFYQSKHKFQNPLRQNYKHTKTLAAILNLEADCIHSLIVFTGDAQFKTKMPDNVVRLGGLAPYIKTKNECILDSEQLNSINTTIESGRLEPSFKTNRAHNKHVKTIIKNKEASCERCGSELVQRTIKKGPKMGHQFWGCSKFPKCRYTREA